jgi:uracil-DNA glycosylase family 4
MSEKYVFKLIEEAVELRKEFPSVVNPWSKKQKLADLQRVKEEFSDVLLFALNIAIVWRFKPEDVIKELIEVQHNNFLNLKKKKMEFLNSDILKIPGRVSGVGGGSLFPSYVFIGQNPGESITQGYKFWSDDKDGSSKVLLPILDDMNITHNCYFTNIVKCTTPKNEAPGKEMTEFYKTMLMTELDILRLGNPDMKIITLGKWASEQLQDIPHDDLAHPATVLYGSMSAENYKESVHKLIYES